MRSYYDEVLLIVPGFCDEPAFKNICGEHKTNAFRRCAHLRSVWFRRCVNEYNMHTKKHQANVHKLGRFSWFNANVIRFNKIQLWIIWCRFFCVVLILCVDDILVWTIWIPQMYIPHLRQVTLYTVWRMCVRLHWSHGNVQLTSIIMVFSLNLLGCLCWNHGSFSY